MTWQEGHFPSEVLFPQTSNSSTIMRKTSDKFELGNVLQDAQPVLPKTEVMINTERLRKRLRPEETGET